LDSASTSSPNHPSISPALHFSSPIEWLVSRQRGLKAAFWVPALIGAAYNVGSFFVFGFTIARGSWPMQFTIFYLPWLAVGLIGSTMIAWAASRFFSEGRRNGEMELLLTTSLGAERIVRDQWSGLKRLLRWPVALLCAPTLLRIPWLMAGPGLGLGALWVVPNTFGAVLGIANTILGVGALCWLGMWFGLNSRNQAVAIFAPSASPKASLI
jgi:hypothetical protein